MIPTQFDYVAAKSLDEAISLLHKHKDDAKLLAGGHSQIPAMKVRLAQPQVLIDISRIKDLSYIREDKGQIHIGSMTTHYQIESSDLLRRACPLLGRGRIVRESRERFWKMSLWRTNFSSS